MVSAIPQRQYGPAYDILIVDNKELTRDTVQKILQQEGYTVDTAKHGREAIEKLRASQYGYRLIITEMIMPFAGGFEVIKAAKRESRIPVLVLSAVADEETISEAFHLNADDFLKKPFMASELIQRIQRLLVRYSVPVYPVHKQQAPELKPQPVVTGAETITIAQDVTPAEKKAPVKRTRTTAVAKTKTTATAKASSARVKSAETKASAPVARKSAASSKTAEPARRKATAKPAAAKSPVKTVKAAVKAVPARKKEVAAKSAASPKTTVPAKKSAPAKKKNVAASKVIIRNSLPMIRKINTVIERHRVQREEKVEKSAA